MSKGKFQNRKNGRSTKLVTVLLAVVLILSCFVGGTIAWLTAETGNVENTFTVGDITIGLTEHVYEDDKLTDETTPTNAYDFVPGDTLPKDPYVTVKAGSEACYLFVKITDTNNAVTGLTGDVIQWEAMPHLKDATIAASGWKKHDPNKDDNIEFWYCEVAASDKDQVWYLLKNDQVTVNTGVTKTMVEGLTTSKPTLTFDAAAVQSDNLSLADAWKELSAWTEGYAAPTA